MSSINDKNSTYQNGVAVRKQVMGEAHVERSMGQVTPFNESLQDWINEHAWGSTWQRGGIDKKTRSLVTMAFLIAQKSPTELKGHIRGAVNNGASLEEIQEVLLHSLPYCGAPATQEAYRAANEILTEMGLLPKP
ncbi:carboxymuconolactone decarboxylase family protein [Moraxella canis]|uniref:Carboxymuconolactone decarboxylase family protein n=1 Tax=Moraxella canis TaxID=90239 RepID=A0ABZ0WZU6_9GAMM|nr:carboxymuconolactone decarboxylase family protein [Moraxella canis]WQE04721.1 carboxymuconolactone decarboxylase family protein [Moraxella canis]